VRLLILPQGHREVRRMVKLVEDSRSPDGFPRVRWEQDVPTGESVYSVEQSIALKIAAVVMVFIFAWAYAAGWEFWSSLFMALFVGGLCLGGGQAWKGGFNIAGVHVPGTPEPSAATLERERRARATAVMGTEHCEALVAPHGETNELYFWVFRGEKPDEMKCMGGAPLADIQAFELGTSEEWFGDLAQAELRRVQSSANWWVIVVPTLGHGVLAVADSGGAKAQIAGLHGLLTKRFVVAAPEMQERWKARLEEAEEAKRRGGSG
jgi:hypothetical protein